jgi:chromosomal replication initiation ATPase DnaA
MMSPYVMPGVKYVHSVTTPQYMVSRILDHFEMKLDAVRVRRRDRKYVTVRAIMAWHLYHKCRWSLQDVADYLRPAITDHTTVIHALRFVQDQLSLGHDNEIAEHIKNIGL